MRNNFTCSIAIYCLSKTQRLTAVAQDLLKQSIIFFSAKNGTVFILLLLLSVVLVVGCKEKDKKDTSSNPSFSLSSSASDGGFNPGETLATEFKDHRDGSSRASAGSGTQCSGNNNFPKLSWSNVPDGTQSFVLIVDDPDGSDFVHLNLYDIADTLREIPRTVIGDLSTYGTLGNTGWGGSETGWRGPCPPSGAHTYYFKLYAISAASLSPALSNAVTRDSFESTYTTNILESAEISVQSSR